MTITPTPYLHGDQDRPQPSRMGDAYLAGLEDARAGRSTDVSRWPEAEAKWYHAGHAAGKADMEWALEQARIWR